MNFQKIETGLKPYKNIIGLSILVMLIILSLLTVKFFDKQNEILETGGYTDGTVKCVCTQEAWDNRVPIEESFPKLIYNGSGWYKNF